MWSNGGAPFSERRRNTPLETRINDVTMHDKQKKSDQRQADRANPLGCGTYLFASIRRTKNKNARRGSTSAGGRVAVPSSKVKMHQGTTVRCRLKSGRDRYAHHRLGCSSTMSRIVAASNCADPSDSSEIAPYAERRKRTHRSRPRHSGESARTSPCTTSSQTP